MLTHVPMGRMSDVESERTLIIIYTGGLIQGRLLYISSLQGPLNKE